VLAWLYPGSYSWSLLPVAGEYLVWGCLAVLADVARGERPLPAYLLLAAGAALHGLAAVDEFNFRRLATGVLRAESVYQSAHGAGFALIVLGLWRLPAGPLLALFSLPPVVYLGRISYGLYVFHNFTYGVKARLVGAWSRLEPMLGPVPGPAVAFAVTVAAAALSWHVLERPVQRLKARYPYSPRAAPPPGPGGEKAGG
jgi:peptidoglycan/LPS O-acetylase OafA/YrhL